MNKKKLILQNIIFFLITFLVFILSITLVTNYSKKDNENNLENYSSIVINLYENEDYSKVLEGFNEKYEEIRVTILSNKDGSVIYDNDPNYNKEEDRLNEFNTHLDKGVYEKYSLTLNEDMYYLVRKDDDSSNYIRVGIRKASVLTLTYNIAIYGSIIFIVINLAYFLFSYYFFKRSISSLKEEIVNLETIVNPNHTIKDFDVSELKDTLNKTYSLINLKIKEASNEKEKYEYILDNISEGFIILNLAYNVEIINNYALKIFNKSYSEVINNNIVYLFNASNLVKSLDKLNDKELTLDEKINNRNYELVIKKIKFDKEDLISIIIININNITKASIMKKEFFANASHELKSPLTSIIGYQELIKEGIIKGEDEIKNATTKTLNEALRMKNIVLDMLELSKLEVKEKKDLSDVNLKEIINQILELNEIQISIKHLKVHLDLTDLTLKANKEDIYKLLSNIISNAINYNNENGSIYLTLKDNTFICKDTGIGISKDDIERIFERFYRVDKSRSKESNGTGLGLAIVKHICINYGYKIEVKSSLGNGSTFIIKFKN